VRAEIRPAAFPDSTSETVDCETPAWRATSTLVTRGGALIEPSYGGVQDLVEWGIPIQQRHLETVRQGSLKLASEEDPNETS